MFNLSGLTLQVLCGLCGMVSGQKWQDIPHSRAVNTWGNNTTAYGYFTRRPCPWTTVSLEFHLAKVEAGYGIDPNVELPANGRLMAYAGFVAGTNDIGDRRIRVDLIVGFKHEELQETQPRNRQH